MTGDFAINFPKVSVIIPLYNAESTIREAIQSIQDTGWPNLQIVVVDDASTDNGPTLVRELFASKSADGWDCILDSSEPGTNRGAAATRNLGVALSDGRYVAFLDADDLYLPNRFDKAIHMLEADDRLGAVFGVFRYQIMSAQGNQQVRDIRPEQVKEQGQVPELRDESSDLLGELLAGTIGLHTSTVTIRMEVFKDLGMFPLIPFVEDQAFWFRLLAMRPVERVSWDPVSVYRIHEESLCSRGEKMPEFIFGPVLSRLNAVDWLRQHRGPDSMVEQISNTIPGRLFAKYPIARVGPRSTQVFMLQLLVRSMRACPEILFRRNYWSILIRLIAAQFKYSA